FFFFQAEDGIRDGHVTGVQTCALPILQRELAVRAVEVLVLHGRRGGQHEVGVVRGVRQHLLVDDGEQVLAREPLQDERLVRAYRSEERRVGKEGRAGGAGCE